MRKFIDFCKSPWPMLIVTGLALVVAVLASLDYSYSQEPPEPPSEQTFEEGPRP